MGFVPTRDTEREGKILHNSEIRRLIRGFAIEIAVYAVLVVGYFFLVLRFLAEPLAKLFDSNLVAYAFIALLLIVVQGVALEVVTSFIISLLGLDKFE
jgi:hypothetical protein